VAWNNKVVWELSKQICRDSSVPNEV
jgi:hypothetical protein